MTLESRFSSKWILSATGCWEWGGCKTNGGYGRIREAGKDSRTLLAHRVAWLIYKGAIPAEMCVCHKCDNRKCVNPDHLFIGSYEENTRDRDKKGRSANQKGEKNGASKLNNKLVLDMRTANAAGESLANIARRMKIPRSTVYNACKKTWKHLS